MRSSYSQVRFGFQEARDWKRNNHSCPDSSVCSMELPLQNAFQCLQVGQSAAISLLRDVGKRDITFPTPRLKQLHW